MLVIIIAKCDILNSLLMAAMVIVITTYLASREGG